MNQGDAAPTPALTPKPSSPAGEAAIVCEGVGFTYPGAAGAALEGVTLRVERGERLGILGPNGGGKSTLVRIVLGVLEGYEGRVTVFGLPPGRARAAGLTAYVAQRAGIERAMPMSVRQAVSLGAGWREPGWRGLRSQTRGRVERAMNLVGVEALAERAIGTLSGGEMQRALIARALAASPRLLLLDEPTVGIDVSGQRMFAELLERIRGTLGITTVVVSHDLRAIAAGSDRVACLARRLHSHMSPEGLTPGVLAEVFSHDVAGIVGLSGGGVHVHAHLAGECQGCAAPEPPGTEGHTKRGGGAGGGA
jgi:zinc transport system ATP-binding protein